VIRQTAVMLRSLPARLLPKSTLLYLLSLATIALCILLWIRAKTIGEDERANAERRALFVGLWPPMFWLIADALRRSEERERRNPGFLKRLT
jgi:positive regulator of sigma E activity